ncbi:MAG: YhdH/YhfP family quinone oxidoreductase [Thiothrix sp.]|nr:YhdH/YhfP family quinone oxidoreductase [Thiothrix sp.]HPQ95378.1 YhdH/YhfP family quinone oxidoreductase [Thiolinea sp.]
MTSFKAFRIRQQDKKISAGFAQMTLDELTAGEVVIKTSWSSINYKDALAATGAGRILRQYPLNGGIDVAGKVASSTDPRFREGDPVLVCGCGLSEYRDGGYAEYVRIGADCVVLLPSGMTEREAMAIGTAGFTAALAVMRMEQLGQQPDRGPVIVTGATGGVGSFATDMLAARGYQVTALTGKADHHAYLQALGASEFLDRHTLEMGTKPLESMLWGGAVDNVGGDTLAWLTRTTRPFGNIASIGLAGGYQLETTVMPFILRGVSLIGINSIEMPTSMRTEAWQRLGTDLKPPHLEHIVTREVAFDELPDAFGGYLKSSVVGRTVVRIGA